MKTSPLTPTGSPQLPGALILVALLTALPAFAAEQAGGDTNWAFSLGLGANYAAREELSNAGLRVDYDLGLPRFRGTMARRIGEHWWLGLELGQRKSKAEFLLPTDGSPSLDPDANDKYSSASLMVNLTREFSVGQWLKPFVGFGAGHAWIDYRLRAQSPDSAEPIALIDDDTTALALQGLLGLRFPLTGNLDLSIAYEYWRAPDAQVEDAFGSNVDLDQAVHSGWLDLTWYPGAKRSAGFAAERANGPAPGGFYLAGSGGITWINDSETGPVTFDAFKPGGLVSFAVGRTLGPLWRAELEYAYRKNDAEVLDFGFEEGERSVTGDFSSSSFAANLHLDLLPNAPIRPTGGIGLGLTSARYRIDDRIDGSRFANDTVSTGFVQATLGLSIEVSRALTLQTGWRVWYLPEHDLDLADGNTLKVEQFVHSVEFALRYAMGT